MKPDNEPNGKQVIARAAAVLKSLENQREGLSLGQISSITGLPRTTVHRLAAALEAQQLVISGPGGLRLGPALARLATSAHTDVIAISRAAVEGLGRETRETVDVSVLRGTHAISLNQYASDQELRVISPVGTAFPLNCTAHGKALLASMGDTDVARLLEGQSLERRTARSLCEMGALSKEIRSIRKAGIAVDREEHAKGVCGVGVILNTGLNERYSISLAVPAVRFDDDLQSLSAALLRCKAEVEALILPS
ncbi:IclR family transcriptional regulator [Pseudomonas syringae pv. syringae PD2774]|uniref:IclR family transcriptional regulator n=1 Tax=Pseudomonas syringae TaxID=317 RepID=UPI000737812F|nr:IclR family transcriptional regulator [Pseudomonas syringae]KTB79606.1 IclR family transcriptional regulator [Pseudomonas syringae pv. syringae PD2774]